MTSGGTESILTAVKASRDYMAATRGITQPEMVVAVSAHAAFIKAAGTCLPCLGSCPWQLGCFCWRSPCRCIRVPAHPQPAAEPFALLPTLLAPPRTAHKHTAPHPPRCLQAEYFKIRLIRLPVGRDFRLSAAAVRSAVGPNTVLVAASAPGFPHGLVDHVEEIAKVGVWGCVQVPVVWVGCGSGVGRGWQAPCLPACECLAAAQVSPLSCLLFRLLVASACLADAPTPPCPLPSLPAARRSRGGAASRCTSIAAWAALCCPLRASWATACRPLTSRCRG